MEREICEIIGAVVGVPAERISVSSNWRQLGIDSIQGLEIIMEIEEKFDVSIADEEGESFSSVADIIACLVEKKSDLSNSVMQEDESNFLKQEDSEKKPTVNQEAEVVVENNLPDTE